ncbi:MAG: hypothetical protein ACTTKL_08285 [Treponema sp.]
MYEIELKAHVYDCKALVERLKTFARFVRRVKKVDEYYHLPAQNGANAKRDGDGKPYVSVRLRTETAFLPQDEGVKECKTFFTYKRKELRTGTDGAAVEVNDEKECILSDAAPLKAAFTDAGFKIAFTKQKDTEAYEVETPFGTAALELCSVPPLGDFLEIEILSPANEEPRVQAVQDELRRLLDKAGIPAEQIESRPYRELAGGCYGT